MIRRDERKARDRRRRSGVTLVEMMIALVVLAFGLLGVAALQVRAITESTSGSNFSTASAIARNRIEELNRVAWTAGVIADSAGAWSAATTVASTDPNNVQSFARSERIADDAPLPADVTIKAIEVRVTWSDSKRQNRQIVMTSARLREVDE